MGILNSITNQLRSIVQWDDPQQWEIFRRFTDRGDELKNASKLILQPGQGCIFTYEGKVQAVFDTAGIYELATSNVPFVTTFKKFMNAFESEHKVGLWFYRVAEIANVRWGTRIPITYNDPVYGFPVNLRGYGNFSMRITHPVNFFSNIIAGKECYYAGDLQELLLSRIAQPISAYLANAKFSYADIDAQIEGIAAEARLRTVEIFRDLGFELSDFRIEGTSFDEATQARIGAIADTQADVRSAQLAGLSYAEFQKTKAIREAANNAGAAGAGVGVLAGVNLGSLLQSGGQSVAAATPLDVRGRLQVLKQLFEEKLIDEAEYNQKRGELLAQL